MSLFFDDDKLDGVVEREEAMHKDKKLETRDQCKAFMRGMDRNVRKERDKLVDACSVYNSLQDSESKMLTLADYFQLLKSRWESQESVQASRLPEYEALDSRWRDIRRRENKEDEDDGESSDSYRDSDDGSSYGEGPMGW